MLSTTSSGEMIELKIPACLFACVYAEKRLLLIFFFFYKNGKLFFSLTKDSYSIMSAFYAGHIEGFSGKCTLLFW